MGSCAEKSVCTGVLSSPCFPSDAGRAAFPALNTINQERPSLGRQDLGSLQAIQNIKGLVLGFGLGCCLMNFRNEFIRILLWRDADCGIKGWMSQRLGSGPRLSCHALLPYGLPLGKSLGGICLTNLQQFPLFSICRDKQALLGLF